jgi:hypothetical protein
MTGIGFLGVLSGTGLSGSGPGAGDGLPANAERLYENHSLWFEPWASRGGETFSYWYSGTDIDVEFARIAGTPQSYATAWGGSVIRRLPWEHPMFPGLFAVRARARGRGRPSSTAYAKLYPCFEITVDFESPPWTANGDTPFMSLRREFSSSLVAIPGRYLRCESDGFRLQQDQGRPIPQVSYLVTIYGISATNYAAIAAASAAPVNSTTLYLPDGLTVAAGYGIFGGVADEQNYSYGGQTTKAVTYRILARSGIPFDQIIHPQTGVLTRVLNPDGTPMVTRSDLNLLWL